MSDTEERRWFKMAGIFWPPKTCPMGRGVSEYEGMDGNWCYPGCAWALKKASKAHSHCGWIRQAEKENT